MGLRSRLATELDALRTLRSKPAEARAAYVRRSMFISAGVGAFMAASAITNPSLPARWPLFALGIGGGVYMVLAGIFVPRGIIRKARRDTER